MTARVSIQAFLANYVPNHGNSCTSAAVLNGIGALGGTSLPDLGAASAKISGNGPYQPPGIFDYISITIGSWVLRRAPIDSRIEVLAASCGLHVRSTTRNSLVPSKQLVPPQTAVAMPASGEILIGNMAYGQMAPNKWGWWGLKPFMPWTWKEAGHSVIIAGPNGAGWDVIDSDNAGVQTWQRPGWAMSTTRIQLLS